MFARVITLLACLIATFPGPLATEVVEYAQTVAQRQAEARLSGEEQPAAPTEDQDRDEEKSTSFSMLGAPLAAPAPVLHTAGDDANRADIDEIIHPANAVQLLVRTHQNRPTLSRIDRVRLTERALVWPLDIAASPIQPLAPPTC